MNDIFQVELPAAFTGAAGGAKLLGVSASAFHKYVAEGLLPSPHRIGNRSLYEVKALIDAVRALPQRTKSEEQASQFSLRQRDFTVGVKKTPPVQTLPSLPPRTPNEEIAREPSQPPSGIADQQRAPHKRIGLT